LTKKNIPTWPETEILVEECLKLHRKEVEFVHFSLESRANKMGRDFWVKLRNDEVQMYLQVKTADNTRTAGYVLPLPKSAENWVISERTRRLMNIHFRKHPDIPCIIFVGKPIHGKRRDRIIEDIWRELMKIFKEFKKRYDPFVG
jgi:hypothetical protein